LSSQNEKTEEGSSSSPSSFALVMMGGGVKGLAYVGALKELEKYYYFNWFVGTSAGAIAAVLLAAGYTTNELEKILSEKNFRDFLDARFYQYPTNIVIHKGLFPADALTDWVDELLAKKLGSPSRVLLCELPHRLTIYASRRDNDTLVFDSEDPEKKNTYAAFAVRCSMAIPYVFMPQRDQGMRVLDGGIRNSYPLDAFLREHPNTKVVGLYLGPQTYEGNARKERKGFLGRDLLTIWKDTLNSTSLRKHSAYTVVIDPRPIKTLQFNISADEKDLLLKAGRAGALNYLLKQSHSVELSPINITQSEVDRALEDVVKIRDKITKAQLAKRRKSVGISIAIIVFILLSFTFYRWLWSRQANPQVFTITPPTYQQPLPVDPNQQSNKINILVVEFQGPKASEYGVTQIVFEKLDEATKGLPYVQLQRVTQAINTNEDARKLGAEHDADIVIWGTYQVNEKSGRIAAHFSTLRAPPYQVLQKEMKYLKFRVEQINDFAIQEDLSSELRYLTLLAIGLARFEKGDYDEVILQLTQALTQSHIPADMVDPGVLYVFRAISYRMKSQIDKAIDDYIHAIKLNPTNPVLYKSLAECYAGKGDFNKALISINKSIGFDAKSADAYNARACVFYFTTGHEKAFSDFDKAISLDPNDAQIYSNRAGIYLLEGDSTKALDDINKASSLDPQDGSLNLLLGGVYVMKGDGNKALEYLNKAVAFDSTDSDTYVLRGSLYVDLNKFDEAFSDFNKAISLDPNYSAAYDGRGLAYLAKNDLDNALADLNKAVNLDSKNASAYITRARVYHDIGDSDSTLKDLNTAIKVRPTLYESYYYRGLLLFYKDERQARADFHRVLELTSDPEIVEEVKSLLEELESR
jgi:tetratricopeptide (TPR) repeat protein/predicted acylesterase/phospholipase RssA